MAEIITYTSGGQEFEVEIGSPLHERLVQQKLIEGPDEPADAAPDVEPEFDSTKASSPTVIEYVNGDRERAQAVLEVEQARGDNARASLVTQLEAIIEAE